MFITSKENNEVKRIKKLYEKKYREQEMCFIVDGIKLVKEAIMENAIIEKIVFCKELLESNSQLADKEFVKEIEKFDCLEVSLNVFKYLSEVQNPQGILAIIKIDENKNKILLNENLFLVLDEIQDPGNIGTIIRTADSAGIKQIICSPNTADCYNSKVIRATMGAIFRVNMIYVNDLLVTLDELKNNGIRILATDLNATQTIYETDFNKSAIIIGNEANGVSNNVLDISNEKIKIPMQGRAESLNAAIATGIVIYEAKRPNR